MNRDLIQHARKARGWTQNDLARAAGISQSMVALLESGQRRSASLQTVRRLAAALYLSLDALVADPLPETRDRDRPVA